MISERWYSRDWAKFLLGFGLFGVIMLLQGAVAARDSMLRGAALAVWGTGAAVALGVALVKRKPRIFVVGVSLALLPAIFLLAENESAPKPALIAAVGAFALAGGVGWFFSFRDAGRMNELERFLYSESASVAFFATMLATLAYALLESWFALPKLHVFWVVGFGCWVQLIASFVLKRRYT